MYLTCRNHGEDDVNAADDGDTGLVHPYIPGCHLLRMQFAYFRRLRWSVHILQYDLRWKRLH